jgi:putative transferase (TIGR04331 family)
LEWSPARLALEWLPSWYVEEFRACHDRTEVAGARNKEFHASFLAAPEERMVVARHVEEGARLTFYQHAAMYGEVPGHCMYVAETMLSDRFRTWGWKLGPVDEPFLALRLIKPPREMLAARAEAGRLLYVMIRQPLPGLIEQTHAVQRRFFAALGHRAAEVVVRPRVNKGGMGAHQVLPEVSARVAAIDSGTTPMTALVSQTRLVVLDMMPSTLFMECVTADVPVIALVPEETTFTPLAAEFYDEFFRLGLLQRTPEEAARFLAGLDPRSWWRDVRGRRCFQDYLRTFCNRDEARLRGLTVAGSTTSR